MIHIIHNRLNANRAAKLQHELRRQGIVNYSIVDSEMAPLGTEHNKRTLYILESHKKALLEGIYHNQSLKVNPGYVLIAEDDVRFPSIDGYKYFMDGMKKLPDDWDIYLSGVYTGQGMINYDGFSQIGHFFAGLHLYAVREKFYDQYLNCNAPFHDTWMVKNGAKAYVVNPFAAIQYNGYSDQRQMMVNDDHHLKGFKIRGLE